ncbi:MAG: NAD(P)H-dependent oxidoreductase subunit E [Oscillospiraceae bacterium]|jgi:NADH-quinone oxidoreductase subunit E
MQGHCLENMTADEKLEIIRKTGGDSEHLLNILLELQKLSARSCINEETAALVAKSVGFPYERVREVISFYAMLEESPRGRYVIGVCNSAPCYYSRALKVAKILMDELQIGMGETTKDGVFSLNYIPCVGACDIGPVIKVGDEIYGNLTPEKIRALIAALRERAREENEHV